MTTTAEAIRTESADPGWLGALRDLPREHEFVPLETEGELPPELCGTLYRNGPGLLRAFGERYPHWFDGDGAVSAVRLANGTALGAARVVRTRGLERQRARGRLDSPGYGVTVKHQWWAWLKLATGLSDAKNPANTAVMWWHDRLFALCEAGLPYELSPADLHTLGESDLGGVVLGPFSAHPHRVPQRRAQYNFGVRYGRTTLLDLYELPDYGAARRMTTLELSGATMIHDFIATPRYLVVFAPPLRLDVRAVLAGRAAFGGALRWKPALGTEIIVVPIDEPERVLRWTVDAFYQWHFANAFERGDELVVDFVRYPDFDSNRWLAEVFAGDPSTTSDGMLARAILAPDQQRFAWEPLWDGPCEFPRIAPAEFASRHEHVYVASYRDRSGWQGLPDAIAKVDASGAARWAALPSGQWPSEAVFVPKPGAGTADDGWLLAQVYDAGSDRTCVAVWDARDCEAGPLARAWFPQHVPPTFHGEWVPAR